MTCTESHLIKQLISDTTEKRGGKPSPMLHWHTSLSEFAL